MLPEIKRGHSFIVVAREAAVHARYSELEDAMRHLLQKAQMMEPRENSVR
jgi:ribonuclease P protein component